MSFRKEKKEVVFTQLFEVSHASKVHLKACLLEGRQQIILLASRKQTNRQIVANYEEMLILLSPFIKSRSLIVLMGLSNNCHRKITPTCNAGRCIVKKQWIISAFIFERPKLICMSDSAGSSPLSNGPFFFSPLLLPFHKAAESFLSGQFILSNFPI